MTHLSLYALGNNLTNVSDIDEVPFEEEEIDGNYYSYDDYEDHYKDYLYGDYDDELQEEIDAIWECFKYPILFDEYQDWLYEYQRWLYYHHDRDYTPTLKEWSEQKAWKVWEREIAEWDKKSKNWERELWDYEAHMANEKELASLTS